ncbi:MAG: dihydrodipicolinate synthase family protein [Rhodospirillaceae bacterium]|jgi:2-keto-3-deoxy-L-arabinonate dehydratase|nr:dihydrodipicolinate synthase family protein [Rhodospirillaceae bacterium]MBT3492506.1 dihydrodipicolinate synthase family protein [Rhodospirillaceae bacterium]MBT3782509.1 dihydrodipicolinate synthase family protein [Rhodospirillaceae bacterium]MBT3979042.1 dihydrodipicolinate synthase family protein [Rhodospirillaceae bacterium]MBT4167215.1 dihydrodipicolinate synthase family protein [Rhodospirillaceae bacterium]
MSGHTGFHGVYPILYSFYDAEGRLDREAMRRQVDGCIAGGAHGIAVMGLATEVGKLDVNERRQVIEWVGEDIAGRVPFAVTVGEGSVPGQIAFVNAAQQVGADWVILQPPAITGVPEIEYVRFLGAVADQADVPLAVQNAPGLMATSLSNGGLKALNSQHPNVCLLKAEGPATYISQLMQDTDGAFDIFGGMAGIQFPDSLRAGCVGMIPAADLFDPQVRIYELMRQGTPEAIAQAEEIHRELLPLIVFMMSSVENFIAYGKHLAAQRLGLTNSSARQPSVPVTDFGLKIMSHWASHLGPFPKV